LERVEQENLNGQYKMLYDEARRLDSGGREGAINLALKVLEKPKLSYYHKAVVHLFLGQTYTRERTIDQQLADLHACLSALQDRADSEPGIPLEAQNSVMFIATNANKDIYHILQQIFKLRLDQGLDEQYEEPVFKGVNHRDNGPWPHSRAFKMPEKDIEVGDPTDLELKDGLGKTLRWLPFDCKKLARVGSTLCPQLHRAATHRNKGRL